MKNNIKKEIDELDQFLDLFSNELSEPDMEFEKNLKLRINKSTWFSFKQFIRGLNFRLLLLPLGLFIFIGIFTFFRLIKNEPKFESGRIELSQNESIQILSEVISKNNYSMTQGNTDINLNSENNYRFTKLTRKISPIPNCTILQEEYSTLPSTQFLYEFKDSDSRYYFKSIDYIDEQGIVNYILSKNEGNEFISYDYKGGDYAVIRNDSALSTIGFTPTVDNTNIEELKSQFGNNIKIFKENGDIILVSEVPIDCGSNNFKTKINEIRVNSSTFEIEFQKTYLDNKDVLIEEISFEVESKTLSIESANAIFLFDLKVELKNIEELQRTYDEIFITESIRLLKEKNIPFVATLSDEYKIEYIMFEEVISILSMNESTYLNRRDFYPNNSIGDKLFQKYGQSGISINNVFEDNFEVIFSNKNAEQISISNSSQNITDDIQIKRLTNITINNEEIQIGIYNEEFSTDKNKFITTATLDFYGEKYELSFLLNEKINDFSEFKFFTFDSSDETNQSILIKSIENYYK